jgi:hypothetical protein
MGDSSALEILDADLWSLWKCGVVDASLGCGRREVGVVEGSKLGCVCNGTGGPDIAWRSRKFTRASLPTHQHIATSHAYTLCQIPTVQPIHNYHVYRETTRAQRLRLESVGEARKSRRESWRKYSSRSCERVWAKWSSYTSGMYMSLLSDTSRLLKPQCADRQYRARATAHCSLPSWSSLAIRGRSSRLDSTPQASTLLRAQWTDPYVSHV